MAKVEKKLFPLKIAIIVSVFSQIAPIAIYMRPIMYLVWLFVLCREIITCGRSFYLSRFSQIFFIVFMLFFLYRYILSIFSSAYGKENYIRVLIVPVLVTIIGDAYSDCPIKRIKDIQRIYVICALIYAIWIQNTFFPSFSAWLSSRSYVFMEKNSAAQIWASAVIILFLYEYNSSLWRILGYLSSIYLLIIIGISQCRTAILGLAVVTCVYAFLKAKRKIFVILVIFVVGVAAWHIPYTRNFIDKSLLISRYAGADLNTVSSGRINNWAEAVKHFKNAPIFGIGQYYVDCSYLLILTENGLIGFCLIEYVWMLKVYQNLHFEGENQCGLLLYLMTFFYLMESLLEGYPPFGPGVSSFMFWLLSAMCTGKKRNNEGVRA